MGTEKCVDEKRSCTAMFIEAFVGDACLFDFGAWHKPRYTSEIVKLEIRNKFE